MIDIQVAGAGAGKTYGLADAIERRLAAREETHKVIFALTYTNTARDKIAQEIAKKMGRIPECVQVLTVHTYLLKEIIYPFSPYILGEFFSKASNVALSSVPNYKAREIKVLKNMHIVHVENTYAVAKKIIDKSMGCHGSRAKKSKVDRVLDIIGASTDAIFLDEAQDLDVTALNVFEVLGFSVVDLYMIGDPKQSIKFPNAFIEFLEKHRQAQSATIRPFNNVSRRVPEEILNLSNGFCYPDQEQESISTELGSLKLIDSTHPDFEDFVNEAISENCLVCIDKKTGRYATSHKGNRSFHPEIQEMLSARCFEKDPELYIESSRLRLGRNAIDCGAAHAVSTFMNDHGIEYSAKIYAQLIQTISIEDGNARVVSSIEAVKGLETHLCLLILTPNTYKYLTKLNLRAGDEFNKEWKKIYVAITRTTREFVVAIDRELFAGTAIDPDIAISRLVEMGFVRIED
jgi:hypothetical protein